MDIRERVEKARQFVADNLFVSRRQLAAVILLSLFIVAGSIILYRQSRPKIVESVKIKKATPVKSVVEKRIKVHVAGAVNTPGVYDLSAGLRVMDAIAMAGGQRSDANLDALNLAAKIRDEEKIMVPVKVGTASPNNITANTAATSLDGTEKVPLNTATAEQLQRLDGVGPVLARRIITYRSSHHVFNSIIELRKVKGIGPKKYSGLKDQISLF